MLIDFSAVAFSALTLLVSRHRKSIRSGKKLIDEVLAWFISCFFKIQIVLEKKPLNGCPSIIVQST